MFRADFDQNRHEMHCNFPSLTFFPMCGFLSTAGIHLGPAAVIFDSDLRRVIKR
jgi:hypothetical protein